MECSESSEGALWVNVRLFVHHFSYYKMYVLTFLDPLGRPLDDRRLPSGFFSCDSSLRDRFRAGEISFQR